MLKMEKNFRGYIEKGYPRKPYERYDLEFWRKRIKQEVKEFEDALKNRDFYGMKEELADISNLVDFTFERVLHVEIDLLKRDFSPLGNDPKGLRQLNRENKPLQKGE